MTKAQTDHFHILSLDGGGSLGVYTLGVLEKVEELLEGRLCEKFKLIYGTSTGSIIGSLLALGKSVKEISEMYFQYIPDIMRHNSSSKRSLALKKCANEVFKDTKFDEKTFQTLIGVVATNYDFRRPMIFKSSTSLFQGGSGVPGFGCKIADAVVASCSASPFFDSYQISTQNFGEPKMIDGGFVANNPTLFAITDAIKALEIPENKIKVLNVGVGSYPLSYTSFKEKMLRQIPFTSSALELFETTIAANSNTIDNLRKILFPNVSVVRINDSETRKKYSTNLLEFDKEKLKDIKLLGGESFLKHRSDIEKLFELKLN